MVGTKPSLTFIIEPPWAFYVVSTEWCETFHWSVKIHKYAKILNVLPNYHCMSQVLLDMNTSSPLLQWSAPKICSGVDNFKLFSNFTLDRPLILEGKKLTIYNSLRKIQMQYNNKYQRGFIKITTSWLGLKEQLLNGTHVQHSTLQYYDLCWKTSLMQQYRGVFTLPWYWEKNRRGSLKITTW